jgi:metallophosphoesterase superfamily enzyme
LNLKNRALLDAWERAKGKQTRAEFAESYGIKPSVLNGRLMRAKKERDKEELVTIKGDTNHLTITVPPGRVTTLEQLLKICGVDLDIWEVERYVINKWEVGRKGITKDLIWQNGVLDGYSEDTGGINVEPLYQVKTWLIRKIPIAIEPVIQPVILKVRKYKIPKARKPKSRLKLALVIPDLHFGFSRDLTTNILTNFHDRDYLSVALAIAKDLQPEIIVFLGDNMDLADWSDKFVRSPEFYFTTQPAINELAWWLSQFRIVCPFTEVFYIEGNHEKRMENSIITHMAAAYHLQPATEKIQLPIMSIPRLLDLDSININWVGNYPDGVVWLNDDLYCAHGDKSRAIPGGSARAILESSEVSVIFGHIHRAEALTRTRHMRNGGKIIKAVCPGFGGRLDGVIPGHKLSDNWSQGLTLVYHDDNVYNSINPIEVQNGKAIYSGKLYESNLNMDEIKKAVDWQGSLPQ